MRRLGILILLLMALSSCEEEVTKVGFWIKTKGFILEDAFLNPDDTFPSFSHRISGGTVVFKGNNKTYEFDLEDTGLEDYEFLLPAGEYRMEINNPPASIYGQERGSFKSAPQHITISEVTDTIIAQAEPNCALLLVKDETDQLDKELYIIERHSISRNYVRYYPLSHDTISGLYYTYFTPDTIPSNPSAFLWFYSWKPGNDEEGLSTTGFDIGYQYFITVLE